MSGPCSMCVHFSMPYSENPKLDADLAKLRAGGWGVCDQGSDLAGFYMSQAAACQFEPTRFLAQPVVEGDGRAAPAAELSEEIDFG